MENNVKYVCNTPNGVNENNFVRNGSRRRPLCGRSLEGYGTRKRLTYNDDNVDTVRAGKRKKVLLLGTAKKMKMPCVLISVKKVLVVQIVKKMT